MIMTKTNTPPFCRIVWPSFGMRAAIEVNIRIDRPLPTPRSVISSPSHMMTAVPAIIVMTIVPRWNRSPWYRIELEQLWNSWPLLASAMKPVDCRIARPMVR